MRRIGLAAVLTVGLALAPLALGAQQSAGKVWHLGVLSPSTTPSEAARRQSPLIQRLNELGYVENRNLLVDTATLTARSIGLPDLRSNWCS